MKFDWDDTKNLKNIRDRGIDFNDAKLVFNSPMVVKYDDRYDYGEHRQVGLGRLREIVIVVVFTENNDDNIIRIISARKANKYERKVYYREIKDRLE